MRSLISTAIDKVLPQHVTRLNHPNTSSNRKFLTFTPGHLLGCSSSFCTTSRLSLAKNDGNHRTPSSGTVDDFRANEERIEREFEAKQKEEAPTSDDHSRRNQNPPEDERIQQVRCRILDAALSFVPTLGWSREAISAGAETCGLPGVVHGMFPNGGAELVHHFYTKCNRQLIEQLKSEEDARPADEAAPVPTEFIARAIKLRLQMIEPYAETWPKALAVMTLPQNVPTSLAQLLTLIDDICYYAGDRSVDVSFTVILS